MHNEVDCSSEFTINSGKYIDFFSNCTILAIKSKRLTFLTLTVNTEERQKNIKTLSYKQKSTRAEKIFIKIRVHSAWPGRRSGNNEKTPSLRHYEGYVIDA